MAVSANRLELLQIADAVAREKVIDREIVLAAMADAIQKAARSRYGTESNIRADINPKTGEIRLQRLLEVVDKAEDYSTQIPLELARDRNPDAALGDFIADPLPPMDFGRIAAQSAKQVIVQKVREAERDRQFDEYKDRIGEIINGTVKRVEYGNVIVDLGRGEGIIRRDEMIPREAKRTFWPRRPMASESCSSGTTTSMRSACSSSTTLATSAGWSAETTRSAMVSVQGMMSIFSPWSSATTA
jgi:N utilization substance protein A